MSFCPIYIHLVFSTKERIPLLTEERREEVFSYIGGALNALGCPTLRVGGYVDHVHALFLLGKGSAISDVVREVKTNATKWFKGRFNCNFAWQSEYAAFSVSKSLVPRVTNYIAHQAEHHKTMTFQEELIQFLEEQGIQYDERYIWK